MDQKKVYSEFNGRPIGTSGDIPDAEESKKFWSEIWSQKKEHNTDARWLKDLKKEMTNAEQRNLEVDADKVKLQCRNMLNWKAPRHD